MNDIINKKISSNFNKKKKIVYWIFFHIVLLQMHKMAFRQHFKKCTVHFTSHLTSQIDALC